MRILALDIGSKRTGAAYIDQEAVNIVMPLETIEAKTEKDLVQAVRTLVTDRKIQAIVIGLPYLPGGKEGAQATFVRERAKALEELAIPLEFKDERYSSRTSSPAIRSKGGSSESLDPNKQAAIAILEAFLAS